MKHTATELAQDVVEQMQVVLETGGAHDVKELVHHDEDVHWGDFVSMSRLNQNGYSCFDEVDVEE